MVSQKHEITCHAKDSSEGADGASLAEANPKQKFKPKRPKMHKVIMHNNDLASFDFVEMVLTTIFNKTKDDATILSSRIHEEGKATVGVYTHAIAIIKVQQTDMEAQIKGMPLETTHEPV